MGSEGDFVEKGGRVYGRHVNGGDGARWIEGKDG